MKPSLRSRVVAAVVALGALVPAQAALSATSADGAQPGQDDGLIAFVRHNIIYTATVDGDHEKQLTFWNKSYRPRFSPDGSRIAYVHETPQEGRDLWVMDADGSHKSRVTHLGDVSQPAWSPNGRWLAFGSSGVQTPAGSVGGRLMKIRSTAPHGSPVAFPMIGLPAELDDDPDTTETLDPPAIRSVDWSPDGSTIVYDSFFNTFPARFDDGWYIVTYDVAATTVDVVGGGCTGDAAAGCEGPVHDPAFAPSGGWIVHTSQIDDFDNENDHPESPNLAYAPVTSRPTTSFPDVPGDRDGDFSPSGDKIVLTHWSRVVIADSDGGHRRTLTVGYNPDWQPVPQNGG